MAGLVVTVPGMVRLGAYQRQGFDHGRAVPASVNTSIMAGRWWSTCRAWFALVRASVRGLIMAGLYLPASTLRSWPGAGVDQSWPGWWSLCRVVPASVNTSIMAGLVVNVPGSAASVRV
jgi:hypothetical protein